MTERQKEIARAIALGGSVQAVAQRLGVRPQAVRRQLTYVFDETGTWSQPQLVGWCVAHGVVTVPELQEVYSAAAGAARECVVPEGPEGAEVGSGPVG